MRQRRGPAASRGMLLSFGSALAAFVATTPFAVLDARRFLSDLGFELVHYSSGHIGFEAGPGVYLAAVTVSFSVGLLLVPLAFTDPETRPAAKIVGVYAAVYIGALSMFQVTFARNLLPVFPAIAIVVGLGAHSALARLRDSLPVMRTVIYLLCLLALLLASTALTLDYVHLEDREPASDWVRNNIEAGSTVVSESYSPWLDPDRFDLRMVPYVIAVDPNQSWDYLLVTHNGSGRFDEDPLRYPEQVATLDSIRTTSCLAAMFPGVVEIRSRECS